LGCNILLHEKNNDFLCPKCLTKITLTTNIPPYCRKCGVNINLSDNGNLCPRCRKNADGYYFDRAFSALKYEGLVVELIHLFKYKQFTKIGYFLADILKEHFISYINIKELDIIIPIPLYFIRKWQREFNQSHILASSLSEYLNIPINDSVVKKVHWRKSQTTLSGRQRWDNALDSFRVTQNKYIDGRNVLVVDDLFTTGATANDCARALKKANANKIFIITLARA
jgi:ComF family protein